MKQAARFVKVIALVGALLCVMLPAAACGSGSSSTTGTTGASVTTPPTVANQGTSPTDVTIPPPDSPATPVYRALGMDNIYVKYWLQIESGWAYVHLLPFTSSNGPTLDTRALLRQNADGTWQVLATNESKGLLTDVGAVAQDQAVPDDFRSRFPDAPSALFPEVRPSDKLIMDALRTLPRPAGLSFQRVRAQPRSGLGVRRVPRTRLRRRGPHHRDHRGTGAAPGDERGLDCGDHRSGGDRLEGRVLRKGEGAVRRGAGDDPAVTCTA